MNTLFYLCKEKKNIDKKMFYRIKKLLIHSMISDLV